ncbi:MAG: hypothetical protein H6622_14935 [Halobacteriovoraceae bacterium]|nr:hypothetical protein [Halobacteriovoraceae bacterium]
MLIVLRNTTLFFLLISLVSCVGVSENSKKKKQTTLNNLNSNSLRKNKFVTKKVATEKVIREILNISNPNEKDYLNSLLVEYAIHEDNGYSFPQDLASKANSILHERDGLNSNIYTSAEWKVYEHFLKMKLPVNPTLEDINILKSDFIHSFTAKELAKNTLTSRVRDFAGCTGDARLFEYIAGKYELETYYVTTAIVTDYKAACPRIGQPRIDDVNGDGSVPHHMNGHQVVAVKGEDGFWRLLNTSVTPKGSESLDYAVEYILVRDGKVDINNVPYDKVLKHKELDKLIGKIVTFPAAYRMMLNEKQRPSDEQNRIIHVNLITSIGKDDVFTHNKLMNKYASGSISSKMCAFNPSQIKIQEEDPSWWAPGCKIECKDGVCSVSNEPNAKECKKMCENNSCEEIHFDCQVFCMDGSCQISQDPFVRQCKTECKNGSCSEVEI